MTLKNRINNYKKEKSLFNLFIFSAISSILLTFVPILFAVKLKPIDQSFIDSLLPIARNLYYLPFRSNDSRNYLLGIIIFLITTLIYLIIYFKTKNKENSFKIHLKSFLYFILFIFCIYTSVIGYKYIKLGWANTISLLYSSLESISSIKFFQLPVYFIISSFFISYVILKLKKIFILNKPLINLSIHKFNLPAFFLDFFVFLFVVILLFNPRYQYSYEKISNYGGEAIHQFHHSNFFVAPINEVINGKMIMVNAQAQYGILLTYFSAVILNFFGFSYTSFNLYNIVISIIYTYVFYVFLLNATKSRILSFIGTIAFIKISFFRIFWPYEVYTLPSTTPIRYFFDIFSFYAIYLLYNNFTNKKLHFASIILSLAFFYNTEIGASIILAYLGVIVIDLLLNIKDKGTYIKSFYSIISLTFFVFLTGFLISAFTFFRVGQIPDWFSYFGYIFFYGKGAFDIPMPFIGSYYFIIIIYVITFYTLIFKYITRNFINFHIYLFILFYGILSFFYYLGFSEPHHLLTIIHPSILLSVILISELINNKSYFKNIPITQAALSITFIFFCFGYFFWEPIKNYDYALLRFNNRFGALSKNYYFWKNRGANFFLSDNNGYDFIKSTNAILSLSKNEKDIVVLSRFDTLIYVMTQKTSLINHPIAEYDFAFIKERNEAINKIIKKRPKYIYVFSEKYSTMVSWTIHEIWDAVKSRYSFVKNIGVVDVYILKE